MVVNVEVLKALAVTIELTGSELSENGARMLADDLDGFNPDHVMGALKRIRYDGVRVTLGNIMSRLDDGRPQAEEAWAMLPKDEYGSAALTDEMSEAMGVALPLMQEGDHIAARMAFKECYTKLVSLAREQKRPTKWFMSIGSDQHQREAALIDATRKNRIAVDHAVKFLAPERIPNALRAIGITAHPLLESNPSQVTKINQMIGAANATRPV
jgi:hypothetical protein